MWRESVTDIDGQPHHYPVRWEKGASTSPSESTGPIKLQTMAPEPEVGVGGIRRGLSVATERVACLSSLSCPRSPI